MSYPLEDKRCLRIGHRGAAAHAPHNSLAGFRRAAELGADLVELDVQCSADGQVVVIHDLFLREPDGRVLPVHDSTLAELQAVDIGWGERVPTLNQALETCRQHRLGIYVEIKDGRAGMLTARMLNELDFVAHCLVGSFRPDWVADFKAAVPAAQTSILFGSQKIDGRRAVALAQACGASFVHPCWESHPNPSSLLTPDWLSEVHSAGLGVITWHEERPVEIAALLRLGVDGICSDRPELLRE